MKLSSKNFIYTVVIIIILTVMILGYFILMLPSLYVAHRMDQDLNTVKELQETYLSHGSYEEHVVRSAMQFTIDLGLEEGPVKLIGSGFQVELTMITPKTKQILSEVRDEMKHGAAQITKDHKLKSEAEVESLEKKVKQWIRILEEELDVKQNLPFEITNSSVQLFDQYKQEGSPKIHVFSKEIIVLSSAVSDGSNHYSTYLALTSNEERVVVTCYGTMMPQMNDLAPVVLNSLPMLSAAIVLFAMIVSFLYSRGIVEPILRLVNHTKMIEGSGMLGNANLEVRGRDEIAELTETLNRLYHELDQNLKTLEQKNLLLEERNKSQEVFLRASSHQLKTPIAAALLLVDGMIHEIGKYKDTKTYLPEVKAQLLSMRKMVEDILYLNHCEDSIEIVPVNLKLLMQQQIACHQVALEEGNYQLEVVFSKECMVNTDRNLLEKIIDNLMSNSIHHSKEGALIRIAANEEKLTIFNGNAHIREEILPDIFEPFVSESGKGHGLGLYIVKYYASLLGIHVQIDNFKDGVLTQVTFLNS